MIHHSTTKCWFQTLLVWVAVTTAHGSEVLDWSEKQLDIMPAARHESAAVATILDVVDTGTRIIAVGDHGVVLLSDDEGENFRQANQVPTRVTLTAVFFIDEQKGWAAGNQGTILTTGDGGENWERQRGAPDLLSLLSIWFEDPTHGFAAGRFATLLETRDGGGSWERVEIMAENDELERNLFNIFPGSEGRIHIAAEAGALYTSEDSGTTWQRTETGYLGSFWSGLTLEDATLLLAGMRGTLYRSGDGGKTWQQLESGTRSSFTDIIQRRNGSLIAVGLNGVIAESPGGDGPFVSSVHPQQVPLNVVLERANGEYLLFGKNGLISPDQTD